MDQKDEKVDVVGATLIDSAVNGIFYERALDEVIVLDAAKKLLYRIRNRREMNEENCNGDATNNIHLLESSMASLAAERQKRRQKLVAAAAARYRMDTFLHICIYSTVNPPEIGGVTDFSSFPNKRRKTAIRLCIIIVIINNIAL